MRIKTVSKTKVVYSFDELSEGAKETVRNNVGGFDSETFDPDEFEDYFKELLSEDGWTLSEIEFSYSFHPSDYCAITGFRTFVFNGEEYELIARIQQAYNPYNEIFVEDSEGNDVYGVMDQEDSFNELTKLADDLLYDAQNKIMGILQENFEYAYSEEHAHELAELNEWEFDENGELF